MIEEKTVPARRRRTPTVDESDAGAAAAEKAAETIAASLKAAEAAQARLAEALAAAEALLGELPRRQEAALADFSGRLQARIGEAEAAAQKAGARVAAGVEAAEAAIARAGEAAAERMRAGTEEALAAAERGFQALGAQAEAARAAMPRQTAGAVLEGLARTRQQVSDFVADRIRHGLSVQSELLGCRNLQEVREVQSRYLKETVERYAAEAGSMARLGSEVVAKALPRAAGRE